MIWFQIHDVFEELDTNGDGKLDQSELRTAVYKLCAKIGKNPNDLSDWEYVLEDQVPHFDTCVARIVRRIVRPVEQTMLTSSADSGSFASL